VDDDKQQTSMWGPGRTDPLIAPIGGNTN
jgi:hypothetical protein